MPDPTNEFWDAQVRLRQLEQQYPEDAPFAVDDMVCVICSHEWRAFYPESCTQLECPNCSHMNDAPEYEDE